MISGRRQKVLVIPTRIVPLLSRAPNPLGPTYSGHSGDPANPHYRHSFHSLEGPPGTARGHSHKLEVEQ